MSVTIQSVLDLARLDLDDEDKVRNTDVNLLQFANDGIVKAYSLRPDLRYGSYATAYADLAATDPFPIGLEYRPGIANYIIMRAESADDAFANEQRAIQGLKMFLADIGMG